MYLRCLCIPQLHTTTTPSPGFPHSPWNPPGVDSFCTWSVSEGLRGSTPAPWCWPPHWPTDRKDRNWLAKALHCFAAVHAMYSWWLCASWPGSCEIWPKRRAFAMSNPMHCDCLPYPRKMHISNACWWPPFHYLLVYSSAAAAIPPKNLPLQTWRPKEVLRLLIGTWFLMICSRLIHVVPRCGFKSTILCANCYAKETEAKQLSIRSISSTFSPPHELKVHHLPGMSCSRKLHQFGSSEWHGRSTKYPAVPPFFLCSWAWVLQAAGVLLYSTCNCSS